MKIKTTVILLLVLCSIALFGATAARAEKDDRVDRLLDLLVEKGVITSGEAEALEDELDATAETAARPQEHSPVNLVSKHIKLKGFMNLASYWRENDTTRQSDTFRIRQARLVAFGEPHPNYRFKMGFAFERNAPILLDAEIDYKYSPGTDIAFGQFKLPLSHESIISGKNIDMIDRAQFINKFRPANGRDTGLKITRKIGAASQLEIGAFNGSGKNNLDTGDPDALVARFSGSYRTGGLELMPEAAYLSAPTETGAATPIEQDITAAAGFAPYDKSLKQLGLRSRYGRFTYSTEFIEGRFKSKDGAIPSVRADGVFHQFGWDFDLKYTLFWRYETYDPDMSSTTASDISWNTLALNYRARKNILYKFNYLAKQEAVGSTDNDEIRLQVMIGF